jgi:hypothetical protein
LEKELLKVEEELKEEGGYFYKKSEPSSVKSGVYRRTTNMKTPSTNESMRVDYND